MCSSDHEDSSSRNKASSCSDHLRRGYQRLTVILVMIRLTWATSIWKLRSRAPNLHLSTVYSWWLFLLATSFDIGHTAYSQQSEPGWVPYRRSDHSGHPPPRRAFSFDMPGDHRSTAIPLRDEELPAVSPDSG